jgi:hypothetical protein
MSGSAPRGSREGKVRITQYKVVTEKIHSDLDTGDLFDECTVQEQDSVDEDGFQEVKLHKRHHTAIRCGKDNSIWGWHIPALWFEENGIDVPYREELTSQVVALRAPAKKGTNEQRGVEDTRSYQFWVGCQQDQGAVERGEALTGLLSHSGAYKRDGEKGKRLTEHCARLWRVMGRIQETAFKNSARVLGRYRKSASAQGGFLAAPWPGMTINRGHEGASVECDVHKDMKNDPLGVAALFVFGTFTDGALIFSQVKAVIPLRSGDGFLFRGRQIAHSNKKVSSGIRHSLVAYARAETMTHNRHTLDSWVREKRLKRLEERREEGRNGGKKGKGKA